jgi:hypothetical protein
VFCIVMDWCVSVGELLIPVAGADPFATFSQEEKRRKYAQLSVFEKVGKQS